MQQQPIKRLAGSHASVIHLCPNRLFPTRSRTKARGLSTKKTRRSSRRTSKETLQKMQQSNHMPTSKEGVLKNDEYDPYAVIVLNQL